MNDIFIKEPPEEFLKQFHLAWKHSPLLQDEKFVYLYALSDGRPLKEYSPDPEEYTLAEEYLRAQSNAAMLAKINLEGVCFFDTIPMHQFKNWFSVRQRALEKLNKSSLYPVREDYAILHKAHVLTANIARQELIFNNEKKKVLYNIFGSATGRLTTEKNSVPVLTLRKDQRDQIKPQNDAFVELDLNAAEIRMLVALSGREQPSGDIHEHLKHEIFGGWGKRSEFKERLFAWLYNPSSQDTVFDGFFSRETYRDFFDTNTGMLTTPFGRSMHVPERKAQNYLLQSTTSDQVVENAYKIQKMLMGTQSTIAFTLHDSIILDITKKDAIMLRDIKDQFEHTRWGKFMSTCKIGKTFGALKEMKI